MIVKINPNPDPSNRFEAHITLDFEGMEFPEGFDPRDIKLDAPNEFNMILTNGVFRFDKITKPDPQNINTRVEELERLLNSFTDDYNTGQLTNGKPTFFSSMEKGPQFSYDPNKGRLEITLGIRTGMTLAEKELIKDFTKV